MNISSSIKDKLQLALLKDDERHLQTISYRRVEMQYECEEGKDGLSMGRNIRERTLTPIP